MIIPTQVFRRFCVLLSCIGWLFCLPINAWADSVDPVATKKELHKVQQRIDALQAQIKRTRQKRSETEKLLETSEQNISRIHRELRTVNQSLAASKQKIDGLTSAQQQLNTAKTAQKDALKGDISAAYRTGRQEYLKMLLNQEQPDKLARVIKYYDYYHQARLARIEKFNQTLQDIETNQTQLNEEQNRLNQLKSDLSAQQTNLQTAHDQRKAALAQINDKLKNNASQVSQLEQNQNELESLLHTVQETLSDLPNTLGKQPFAQQKGQLSWPSKGRIKERFGTRRENGAMRWNGVLIATGKGDPVKAIHHGRVVFSDWMRGFGMLTIIDHGDGYLSLYGHNETLLRNPGDWVNGGEIIASTGNSGGQKEAGLYFEIRKNGKPINPSHWCKG